MAWAEYGACPVTVGVDGARPERPASVPEGAWVAHVDEAPAGAVRVDRGTEWGNPFKIGRDGDRREVIRKYEGWLRANPDMMARLPELRGKTLACHCYPLPCHAEVLSRWANDPDSIPAVGPQEAPIPVATPARVWRPADDSPIRIMVTGSRKWSDTERMEEALSWAVRNARTTYPGRRIELVHGGAAGADTLAADYWARNNLGTIDEYPVMSAEWAKVGRGAGHQRNRRMVTTQPHVVLAFDKDGSPGTAGAIKMAREVGLPVYVFHDTAGMKSHTAYPGRDPGDNRVQLTDATEDSFALTEQDMEILGYHNPNIPFRGINRELARYLNAEGRPPAPKRAPIKTAEAYETHLAETAFAAEPDWGFWGTGRPLLNDHRRAPYTDAEHDLAAAVWAEEMDDFITTLTHRAQARNKEMYDYDLLALMDSGEVRDHAERIAKDIDTWVRDRRNPPEDESKYARPKEPKVRKAKQVSEEELVRQAQETYRNRTGKNGLETDEDRALYESIKREIQGPDAVVHKMTASEQARVKWQRWERWANRGGFGKRLPLTQRWGLIGDAERSREIAAAKARGVILDPETGERIGTTRKRGERYLEERMVVGEDGIERPVRDYVDPGEERIYTRPEDIPKDQREQWRDPLDSDRPARSRSTMTDEEIQMLAESQFFEKNNREPGIAPQREIEDEDGNMTGKWEDDPNWREEDDWAEVDLLKEDIMVEQSDPGTQRYQEMQKTPRGITQENVDARNPEFYGGEPAPRIDTTPAPKRAPKQVSPAAQQLIADAIAEWPKHSKVSPPKIAYPDRPGLDAYRPEDAAKLRDIILIMLKRTGGLG